MDEYNLTITDIEWEDGNEYEIDEYTENVLKVSDGELFFKNTSGAVPVPVTRDYSLESIAAMKFKKRIDWSKVPVDTKILVKGNGGAWEKRHFAEYVNGLVYTWGDGMTSWTVLGNKNVTSWKYAKLAEECR